MAEEQRDPRTYAIIGAGMDVHRELGSGFLESVYQECLAIEMNERGMRFLREVQLPVHYKGRRLSTDFRADFLCFEQVVVEVKAQSAFTGVDEAQLINYLKATGYGVGLLLNFGESSLKYRRFVL